jgi:hypothetical protein
MEFILPFDNCATLFIGEMQCLNVVSKKATTYSPSSIAKRILVDFIF